MGVITKTMTITTEIDIYGLIGRNIKDRRLAIGCNQTQIAGKCFINRATLCHIELGNQKPSIDLLMRIADALECDLLELFNGYKELK